jgi:hypothetical protein
MHCGWHIRPPLEFPDDRLMRNVATTNIRRTCDQVFDEVHRQG